MDEPKSHIPTFRKLGRWIKTHRPLSTAIIGIIIVCFALAGAYVALALQPAVLDIRPLQIKVPPKPIYAPLTGLEIKDEKGRTKPVTGIIIENSPDARPQSGLKAAEVVYEAIAEGGITRFLALYQQNKPQLIGPVRSLRPYHLDWLKPYDASIAHVGGSSAALGTVRNGNWRDLEQFFNGNTYWRVSDRYAPHNVYTSFNKLDALNRAKGYKKSEPKEFLREDEEPVKKPNATRVTVNISSALFNSSYRYDKKNNRYVRSQAGVQHKDREKGAITPKVVIVLNVAEHQQFQDTVREVIKTTGSGKATIFQNGTVIKATWRKASRSSQLTFTDAAGEDVALARGQTWITAIPNGRGNVSWR